MISIVSIERMRRVIELHPDIDDKGRMSAPVYVLRNRHTKTAIGMTKTIYRSCHTTSAAANRLGVKGTTDGLGSNWIWIRRDRVTGKFQLTDTGRRKLARLKEAK